MSTAIAEPTRTSKSESMDLSSNEKSTVLCIDDETNILNALKRLLRRAGHNVLTADNGEDGLALLDEHEVDVIISDMRMPNMTGDEVLRRAAERSPDTARILLTGYADLESTIKAVNEGRIFKYISKPWDDDNLRLSINEVIRFKQIEREREEFAKIVEQQNEELKRLNEGLEEKVEARTRQLKEAYQETVSVFSQMIELRDGCASGHGRRVAKLTKAIGRALDMSGKEVQDLYFASLLHNIGKVGMPTEMLLKPESKLSEAERETLKENVIIGPGLLVSIPVLEGACKLIRAHHEKLDGSGYPDGLKGSAIPLGARILAVVNEFDNLVTGAITGKTQTKKQALGYIESKAETEYDPRVVKALASILRKHGEEESATTELTLSTDRLATGMVLVKDLKIESGVVLLAAETELTRDLIDKLAAFENDITGKLVVHVRVKSGS